MKIKKQITTLLLILFGMLQFQPMYSKTFDVSEESLQEFLKTTEDIKLTYNWSSYDTNRGFEQTVVLPSGTPVSLRALTTVKSSEIKSGDIIKFTVNSDVKTKDGYTVIKAGSDVSAEIIFSRENGKIGKSGMLQISNFHTKAADGSYIPLAATLSDNPDDEMIKSILLSVFICPLFLLMEGKEAVINAGRTQIAYTHSDIYINKNALIKEKNKPQQRTNPQYSITTPNITIE